MNFYEERKNGIILNVRVIPRAARDSIQSVVGDALKIRLKTPPVDGRANAALFKFLAKCWGIPKSTMEILSGKTNRSKRILIKDPSEELKAALRALENE